MNELPSSDFRKTFPRLKEATQVNANGHAIGLWIPFDAAGYAPVEIRGGAVYAKAQPEPATTARLGIRVRLPDGSLGMLPDPTDPSTYRGFNSRPFTPAPKPGK